MVQKLKPPCSVGCWIYRVPRELEMGRVAVTHATSRTCRRRWSGHPEGPVDSAPGQDMSVGDYYLLYESLVMTAQGRCSHD